MAQPLRMCAVCRQRIEKNCLSRYIMQADENGEPRLMADPKQNMPGRGLYVCQKVECQKKFFSRKMGKKNLKKG